VIRLEERPLTARSVVASVLLGTQPPELPGRLLVRAGELFGIAEGTVRVALSRMVAAGELEGTGDGRYRLAGRLLGRQVRQDESRRPRMRTWKGDWVMAAVTADSRSPSERAALREAMRAARMAELREGVWLRPDNLPVAEDTRPSQLDEQCSWFTARPAGDDAAMAAALWDLERWMALAGDLLARMQRSVGALRDGDATVLGACFVVAANALRHLTSDPLLPPPLLPAGWNGDDLRRAYDEYEAALQSVLRRWFRTQS
jgi:phenylacetic acid degradation operon negative regulatory protein